MNSAIRTTLLMLIVAVVLVLTSLWYYPWPAQVQTQNEINKPLFEDYSTQQVKRIQIEKFEFVEANSGIVQKFALTENRNQWLIANRGNFPANNVERISAILGSLQNLIIEELTSQDQKDYGLYGVNDPNSDSPTGKGTLLRLDGSDGSTIASLIVGESPEDRPTQKYVRVPDQPQVFLVAFDDRILSLEFTDWIGTNLMRLNSTKEFNTIQHMSIDRVASDDPGFENGEIKSAYRARLSIVDRKWKADVWKSDDDGQLNDKSEKIDLPMGEKSWLVSEAAPAIQQLRFVNVKSKQDLVASNLAKPTTNVKPIEFSAMIGKGFRHIGFEDQQHQFVSAGGKFSLEKSTGVRQVIYFGKLANSELRITDESVRYAFLVAEVDFELLPKPEKNDDPDEQRQYQAKLKLWEDAKFGATKAAGEFNQYHSKWYYVVPESIYAGLVPEIYRLTSEE